MYQFEGNFPSNAGIILDIYSMCGIAGIIISNNRTAGDRDVMQRSLEEMAKALRHRGPDGETVWINPHNTTGFGHRRLCIIDLSEAGRQPMHYLDRYTIIHNGEVYNYIELREELKNHGYSFRSQTDTEVIVAAYDRWKDECVDHFDGMFAFAVWDEKEQELFAARDRFGEKPFFYYLDNERFLFASEMKALWAAGVPRQPNLKMIFNFITIGYVDNPAQPGETFFEHIHKLPAATCLKFRPHTHELLLEKYWDIDPAEQEKNISDSEAIETFDELFRDSVKRRLRSDVTIGTSLSGGLDSSSVAAMISELRAIDYIPQAFTAVFPGFEKDEQSYARQVAEATGAKQFTISISVDELINDWEKLLYHQEEPFDSASLYAQYKVFELAQQHGAKVLLDGQGADEVLGGYHKYYKWYWQELFHQRKLLRSGELKAARVNGVRETFGPRNIVAALFPDLASVVLEHRYLLKALKHEDLAQDFTRLQSGEAYYSTPALFNLNGALHFSTCTHGLEELLRYADRNSMAHGREVRLPFLSHELVEFIFSLPSAYKIRKGWTKWILRETMQKRLPANIAWRKDKVGFEPPQKDWMQDKKMQEMIRESKKKLVDKQILKPAVLNKPVQPTASFSGESNDWRYLVAAGFL